MSDDVKLSPCPFCGGDASIRMADWDEWVPECDNRDCSLEYGRYATKQLAAAAWNRRAIAAWNRRAMPDAGPATRAMAEKVRRIVDSFACDSFFGEREPAAVLTIEMWRIKAFLAEVEAGEC